MGAYSNLYSLLKEFAPSHPENQSKNLRFKKKVRKKKMEIKCMFFTGRKDIRKNRKWKGLVDVSMEGYMEEMAMNYAEEDKDICNEAGSEDEEDDSDMIEYLNRPFISLDESLIADCSPNFIRRTYHALRTLCSIEMKSKQEVYLYQEKGLVFHVI